MFLLTRNDFLKARSKVCVWCLIGPFFFLRDNKCRSPVCRQMLFLIRFHSNQSFPANLGSILAKPRLNTRTPRHSPAPSRHVLRLFCTMPRAGHACHSILRHTFSKYPRRRDLEADFAPDPAMHYQLLGHNTLHPLYPSFESL